VARSFADEHALRTEASKALDGQRKLGGVRVDMISGNVIDEVGFEQDTFTANVQVKQLQPGMQDIFEVVRIRFDAGG